VVGDQWPAEASEFVMPVQSYQQLIAWQKAMDFVAAVYKITRMFPKEEMYGLTSQLRRAAVSIPSNIAEGQGRQTTAEFRQFLGTLADLYWKRNTNSARVAL
jgi:hypothetical protein